MILSKKQKTELILLVILIIILVIVTMWAKNIITSKPKLSTGNNDTYEITKIYTYNYNIYNLDKYNIPNKDIINYQTSEYKLSVETIDNLIKNYQETITIKFTYLDENITNTLTKYCNTFNEIEHNYEFRCEFEVNKMIITNKFDLSKLNSIDLKTNKKEVKLLYNYNDNINDYLNNSIQYKIETK